MNLKTAFIVTAIVCLHAATGPTPARSSPPLPKREGTEIVISAPYFTKGVVTGPYLSLLDHFGRMRYGITPAQISAWKTELKTAGPSAPRAARLHIWLGECALAQNEQPELALWHFREAQRIVNSEKLIVKSEEPAYGLALYDSAVALYFAGAYADSAAGFHALMTTKVRLCGFDGCTCALWMRQAEACASYHDEHSRLGIPEPTRLDPMCAAAALAAALRSLGLPYDRTTVLKACRVTGEGSSLGDVIDAGPKLGVVARAVHADDVGLIALPKPLVAYVEHDHFIAVTRADKAGVGYLCSDCGAWPGGEVSLTWKQWHTMAAGTYAVITRPRSRWDKTLAATLDNNTSPQGVAPGYGWVAPLGLGVGGDGPGVAPQASPWKGEGAHGLPPIRFASTGDIATIASSRIRFAGAAELISHHVYRPLGPVTGPQCGTKIGALHPYPYQNAPYMGDPVDLATGEENYASAPDMVVKNPYGPDVVWSRNYDSLRPVEEIGYNSSDYGVGWSDSYNSCVLWGAQPYNYGQVSGAEYTYYYGVAAGGSVYIVLPNGSTVQATAGAVQWTTPPTGTPASPYQNFSVQAGTPMSVTLFLGQTTDWQVYSGGYFEVVMKDRTTLIYDALDGGPGANYDPYGPLVAMIDRNGNSINFNYTTYPINFDTGGVGSLPSMSPLLNLAGGQYYWGPLLTSITVGTGPATGTPLLTITRNTPPSGTAIAWTDWEKYFNIKQITDDDQRSVYYTENPYQNVGVDQPETYMTYMQELDHVSRLQTSTPAGCPGQTNLPDQYVYGYQLYNNLIPTETVPFLSTVSTPSPAGGSLMSTVTFTYNPTDDSVSSMVDAEGNQDVFTEINGTTTKETIEDPSGNAVYSHTMGFDNQGDWITDTDGTNSHLTYQADYPSTGDIYQPDQVTDGNNNKWLYAWDQYGNLGDIFTPNGLEITNSFNDEAIAAATWYINVPLYSGWNVDGITIPNLNLGELTQVQTKGKAYDLLPATNFPSYEEPQGLPLEVQYPAPSGGSTEAQIDYAYDTLGNLTSVTAPGDDGASSITTTIVPGTTSLGQNGTSSEALGEPASVYDNKHLGNSEIPPVAQYDYDPITGYLTGVTDAEGNTTTIQPNAFGQPDYLLLPATGNTGTGQSEIKYHYAYVGGPANGYTMFDESGNAVRSGSVLYGSSGEVLGAIKGSGAPVQYGYDAAYRLTSITDGNDNVTSYTYGNPAGYLSTIVDPGLGTEQFSQYDGNGDPEIYTGINGITQTYSYDDDGDLNGLAVYNPDYPSFASLSVTPTLDEFDRVTGYTTGATGYPGSETVTYGFTTNNAYVNSVTHAYAGGPAPTVGYNYYDDFNRNTMSTPMGTFTYGHDADGNITSVTDPSGVSVNYQWSADGLLKTLSHASGGTTADTTTYSYNPLNMLIDAKTVGASGTLAEFGGAGGGGSPSIAYDALGDTLSVPTNVNGATGTSSYGYDAQSQLVSETTASGASNAYSYDNAGNATLVRGYGTAFNSANEDASVQYRVGDPLSVEGQSAEYDGLDRLTSIGSETNTYTADGLRESTTANGGTTYFVYDGDEPIGEMGSSGTDAINLFGPTGLAHRSDGSGSRFYLFDTQGNTAARLDNSGNVLDTHAFDAYGKEITSDSTNDPFVGFGAQYGYYSDRATGLDLLGHRFYDPVTARFVTRDPIGLFGGLNEYEYAANNPLSFVDPSGFDEYNPWSSFFGAWGDTLTFGGTKWARLWMGEAMGIGDANYQVHYDTAEYFGGTVVGIANSWAIGGAGSLNAGARSIFYAGGNGAALAAARLGKGAGLLLEDTLGGKALNWVDNALVSRDLPGIPTAVWKLASGIYAANALGPVTAFLRNPGSQSIWSTVEQPILNLRNIPIYFK